MLFDEQFFEKGKYLIGMDEAGRGPLAGPVFTGALILESKQDLRDLSKVAKDSKKLNFKQREERFEYITKNFQWYSDYATSEEIDDINIFKATQLSMNRNYNKINKKNSYCLIDGKNFNFNFNFECIIKGDDKSFLIGGASIIAKVLRDRYMINLHEKYPMYEFDRHKGYPTKKHIENIKKYGIFSEYRLTFNPVKSMIIKREIIKDFSDISKIRLFRIGVL
ncbi:ribonuclease HII [Oceanotoga sp. DSM 15011]|jgi:ribonuclease HII|uniref:ribonuclease HII n=1 Tax=unclassified Oceanotoga TaxID=2618448 RepID=UPI0021F407C0|nr:MULTISPECIES: ribonuclease HII [unclassified Oceanotoga]MDN5342065.1 ribonuclease [Oceanotoga sp.]UYP00031.1 ribonuclease HII [Oceanotoga sp. DSM 15011]